MIVNALPTAVASNGGSICPGESGQLLGNTVSGASYEWRISGSSTIISTEQNPVILGLTSTTTYELTVLTNGCASDPVSTTTLVVDPAPTAAPTFTYTLNPDCSPSDLSLFTDPSGGTAPYTFVWSGPNSFSSSLQNPTISNATIASNGTYDVVVTDANGCTTTSNVAVSGISNSIAQPLISSSGQVCDGGAIVLSIPSYSGSSVDYVWTLPDSTNVSGLNTNQLTISPVDSTLHEGNYSVEVTVDGCVVNSDTFNLELHPTPTATPTATAGGLCEGDALTLTANATGASTYAWSGPNGFTSTAINPTLNNITVSNNGTYVLTVTNITGCSTSSSVVVSNIAPTPATSTITSNGPVCEDENITLSIQEVYTGTAVSYNWTNGAGTSIGTGSSLSFAASAATAISPYRVQVTVDGCSSELSAPHEVIVNVLPIAVASNGGSICPGESGQLLGNTISGASYEWRISGSSTIISTEQNPVILGLTSTTTYELTVLTNGCASDPVSTTTLVVDPAPTAAPTFTYTLNPDCSPSDLSLFTNPSSGTAPYTFAWSGPNSFSSSLQDPTISNATIASNGTYDVVVTDANGCTTTSNVAVSGISNSIAQPVISSTGPGCEGEQVILSIPSYSGSNVVYSWTTPGGITQNISGQNTNVLTISPLVDLLHQGNYSVEVTVDGCTLSSPIYNLNVFDTPVLLPSYSSNDSCTGGALSLFANASGGTPLTYEWSGPNGFSSTLENPIINDVDISYNGQYSLTVISVSGCTATGSLTVNSLLPPAEVPTIASPDVEICEGEDMVLTTSASGVLFEWIGPLGASQSTLALTGLTTTTSTTNIGPGHPSYLGGEYRVRVTDANGCVATSGPINISISEIPVTIANNNSPVCEGEQVQLTAGAVPGANYRWYDDDPVMNPASNLMAMTQNPLLQNLSAGSYDFYVVATVDGCSSEPSRTTIIIWDNPVSLPNAGYTLNPDCSPSDLSLEANVSGGTAPLSYSWSGPNNYFSAVENPIIGDANASANGSYVVTVTDANGCTGIGSVQVSGVVDALPMPIINSSNPSCDGTTVVLSVPVYQGSVVDYIWTLPSTTNVTGLNSNQITISPVDSNFHQGNYYVNITVDGCMLSSDTFNLDLFNQPTLAPAVASTTLCEGDILRLEANATDVVDFEWTGPNGFISYAENPQINNISVLNNGTYSVSGTSLSGCEVRASIVVDNIVPIPAIPTITTNGPVCADEMIVLSIQQQYATTGVTYNWTNGAGITIGTTASLRLDPTDASAISPYRVVVAEGACSSELSEAVEVLVNELPTAIATNAGAVCVEESGQLFANAIPSASYEWRIAGSPTIISTQANPVILDLNTSTTFELTVISAEGCISDQLGYTTIEVHTSPSTSPVAAYTLNADCTPADLMLSANATGSGLSYSWTGPNGFTSNAENPILPNATTANNGTYTLIITDQNGCSVAGVTNAITNIVNQVAEPIVSSTGPACEGDQIVLSVPQYSGSNVSYTWTVPSTTNVVGLNNNELIISPVDANIHQGNYTLTVAVDGCILSSAIYTVTVYDTPSAAPVATSGMICEGEELALNANASGVGFLRFNWVGPNGFSSALANPTLNNVSTVNNGQYTLTATSASGCTFVESILVDNILTAPVEPNIFTESAICEGDDIILTTSTSGFSFEWIGPLGASQSTLQLPGLTTSSGTTTLPSGSPAYLAGQWQVRVTDANGCTRISNAATVEISEVPVAFASNNGPVCQSDAVQLTASPVPGAEYRWYFEDPVSIPPTLTLMAMEQNPTLYNLTVGTHNFYLSVIKDGCESATPSRTTVVINDQPVINNISGGGSYCEGEDILLSASNSTSLSGNINYTWSGPNGFTFTGNTSANSNFDLLLPNADQSIEGSYTLQLISASGCRSQTQSVSVDLDAIPATPQLDVVDAQLCEGEDLELNANAYTGTPVSYEWFFTANGNTTSLGTTNVPTYFVFGATPVNTGVYSVAVTVDGCPSSASNAIDVEIFGAFAAPPAGNSTSAVNPACEGDLVQLQLPFYAGASYQWFGPNGFSSNLPSPVINPVTVDNIGNYYAQITLPNNCAVLVTPETFVYIQQQPEAPTIVNNGPACVGSEFELSVSSPIDLPPGTPLSFDWYYGNTNTLLGTTSNPFFTVSNVQPNNTGNYYVVMTVGDCQAEPSEVTIVQVDYIPTNQADAGPDVDVCATTTVTLDAEIPTVGSGYWTSPSGATISNPDQHDSEVIDLIQGANIFVWTLSNGACLDYDADTMIVHVNLVPADIAYAGDDLDVCGEQNYVLNANVPVDASGEWSQSASQQSQGIVIADPSSPSSSISGLVPGESYEFTWTLSQGVCEDYDADIVILTVYEAPPNNAYIAEEEIYNCGNEDTQLAAQLPSIGTGFWTTTSGATIIDPLLPSTTVEDLDFGENMFVWTLSNGACSSYSSDTLFLYLEDERLAANSDHFQLNFDETLEQQSLIDNDFLSDINELEIMLIEPPINGRVTFFENGLFSYTPEPSFFGTDQFIYRLCNVNCREHCDTALVTIRTIGVNTAGDCWVPDVITPNNDQMNDQLVIPCLDVNANNRLCIFNRWGDRILEAQPYANDWNGTFNGQDLPPGTYFYVLQPDLNSKEVTTGYFNIVR
ncbi:MAG: gliding motility-associated C-terminal domain-containing protein [Bacteroidota bacterium]